MSHEIKATIEILIIKYTTATIKHVVVVVFWANQMIIEFILLLFFFNFINIYLYAYDIYLKINFVFWVETTHIFVEIKTFFFLFSSIYVLFWFFFFLALLNIYRIFQCMNHMINGLRYSNFI